MPRARSKSPARGIGQPLRNPRKRREPTWREFAQDMLGYPSYLWGGVISVFDKDRTLNDFDPTRYREKDEEIVRAFKTQHSGAIVLRRDITCLEAEGIVGKIKTGEDGFKKSNASILRVEAPRKYASCEKFDADGFPKPYLQDIAVDVLSGRQYFNLFGALIASFPRLAVLDLPRGHDAESGLNNADSFAAIIKLCPNLKELHLGGGLNYDGDDDNSGTITRKGFNSFVALVNYNMDIPGTDKEVHTFVNLVNFFEVYGRPQGKISALYRNLRQWELKGFLHWDYLVPLAMYFGWGGLDWIRDSLCAYGIGEQDNLWTQCQEYGAWAESATVYSSAFAAVLSSIRRLTEQRPPPRQFTSLKINGGLTIEEMIKERIPTDVLRQALGVVRQELRDQYGAGDTGAAPGEGAGSRVDYGNAGVDEAAI